jgi:hypothetical protein
VNVPRVITYGESIDVEVCVTPGEDLAGKYIVRPRCDNVNLLFNGVSPTRRYPLFKPVGIICPDPANPGNPVLWSEEDDQTIDVVEADPNVTLCIQCSMNDFYVFDPQDNPPYVDGLAEVSVSGRYVTKGIIDPDPPDPSLSTQPDTNNTLWCLEDDGRVDVTPVDQQIPPITLLFGNENYWTYFDIIIKPGRGDGPAPLNLGSGGKIPVGIMSTEQCDATKVIPETVSLQGASVAIKGKGKKSDDPQYMASDEDLNGDGLLDKVVHVETEALQLSEGATEVLLTAETSDPRCPYIKAVDEIVVVPDGQ